MLWKEVKHKQKGHTLETQVAQIPAGPIEENY